MKDNLRGALLMVAGMGAFAVEDMFVKKLTATMPVGQILVLLGAAGFVLFGAVARVQGDRVFSRDALRGAALLRSLGEAVGAVGFVLALSLVPLSTASAILQALPLVVTLGAALFLRESVGWRRWLAILVGFAGMLLILRPFGAGFDPAALLAVLAVAGLGLRDVATRRVAGTMSSVRLAAWGFGVLMPAGLVLMPFGAAPHLPTGREWGLLGLSAVCGIVGYYMMTLATRLGEVAVVAPFRYARLVFALVIGAVFFAEMPDAATLAGSALIIGSGLFTLYREHVRTLGLRGKGR